MIDELRQIKRILAAILGCLAIIALAQAPVLIPLLLIVLGAWALSVALRALFGITQFNLSNLWFEISKLWRE